MTDHGIPMLSDFGQARTEKYTRPDLFKTTSFQREKGTLNWIAPEIATFIDKADNPLELKCTEESDVWSYGMVVYVSAAQILHFPFIDFESLVGTYYW